MTITTTSSFDYDLPPELIAQEALADRSSSRMMVVHRDSQVIEHALVSDLPAFLAAGDLLVFNDTKVIPARVFGHKKGSGGQVELLLVEEVGPRRWIALCRASRRPRLGAILLLAEGKLEAEVVARGDEGLITIQFNAGADILKVLAEEGITPLPPYIKRPATVAARDDRERERYQTVYAAAPGAVAAPTAGLHFTPALLTDLADHGVERTSITLHVGLGTFKPVKAERVEDHAMEAERYIVSQESVDAIQRVRRAGGRVVAVGSTSVRTLETVSAEHGVLEACAGRSRLFIYPPYEFRVVDAMLTNFHLPMSTLIMMISAFAGRELILDAYRQAVAARYRFYSYGDCMLIL